MLGVLELLLLEEKLLLLLHLELDLARDKGVGFHGIADLDGQVEVATSDLDVLGSVVKTDVKAVSTVLETLNELDDRKLLRRSWRSRRRNNRFCLWLR